MRKLLLNLMGCYEEPHTTKRCAWRYKVEEYLNNDSTIPIDERPCEDCSGYPVNDCSRYTTLGNLKQYYELFTQMKDVEVEK